MRLAAEAENEAAIDRAAALLEETQADANAITIRAEAKKADLLATAEDQTAIANSENEVNAEIIAIKIRLASLEAMPAIIAAMVKPAEKKSTRSRSIKSPEWGAPPPLGTLLEALTRR